MNNRQTMEGLVKNTLMFRFPDGATGPSVVEMARFAKSFDADKFTMESVYKISEERCLCIKFMNERSMKDALMQNPEKHVFEYSNGEKVQITMSVAGGCSKYIRIFDLPPEVPDQEISLVLSKYGVVRRMVRERFPAQLELDLTTGVRGVYIEAKKEIPATLFFLNRRGRVYYEGVKHKCFLCKEEGHLKAECPRNKANQKKANDAMVETSAGPSTVKQTSYAAMLKSKAPVTDVLESTMTVLVPATAKIANNIETDACVAGVDDEDKDATRPPADEGDDDGCEETSESESVAAPAMEMDECSSVLKRQHDSSSTEDEGFNRVTRSRKQKKEEDVLNVIASVPVPTKGSGKSKPKN